jgi:hypothetical protein
LLLFHKLNSDLNFKTEALFPKEVKLIKQVPCLHAFMLTCFLDLALHPLFLIETRYMLQNRHPHFSVYKSTKDLLGKSWRELYRGALLNIPRNFFIALTGLKLTDQLSLTSYYLTTLAFQTLAYPFLTLQKRLESRSALSGLLDNELYNRGRAINCAKTMIKQEGLLSLYKGYTANTFALVLFMSLMPKVSDFLMEKLPLYIDPERMKEATESNYKTENQVEETITYKFDQDDEDDDDF